jgi:membrane fusion protein (multidrug efflux system)
MTGRVTAINPQVESSTRNVEVQATVPNPHESLRPGMFVDVTVLLPARREVLVIPATAVLYAPYGDSVFVVEGGKLSQRLVRLGERRGDFVAVRSGLGQGQVVASTGVFKLRNGQSVVIDNSLRPRFKLRPTPEEN